MTFRQSLIMLIRGLGLAGLFLWSAAAAAQSECATSCSLRCAEIVDQYEQIAAAHRYNCEEGQTACIPNCISRYIDGTCRDYGRDFCGRSPVCVARCQTRYLDGSCRDYSSDFCGEFRAACVQNCTARYIDGSCRDFGPDVCGRNPSCRPSCNARFPDGSCRDYGPDVCVTGDYF